MDKTAEEIAYGIRPLVITLYPKEEGYQLRIPGRNGTDSLVEKFSYEDSALLDCVDRAEIPFFLTDLLEKWPHAKLFFNGCLLVELRDRRYLSTARRTECPTSHVVLRPTNQSICADVNMALAEWELEWGQPPSYAEALELESCLVALNAGQLDLDSPMASESPFHCEETEEIIQSQTVGRLAKKRRSASVAVEKHLKLCRLIANVPINPFTKLKEREVELNSNSHSGDSSPPLMDKYDPNDPSLISYFDPTQIADMREAKVAAVQPVMVDQNERLVEEFLVEAEKPTQGDKQSNSVTRLRLKQNLIDRLYSCDLIVSTVDSSGSSDSVSLGYFVGTDRDLKLYVGQFFEMITEEGRKPMKISRLTPGQQVPLLLSPAEIARLQESLSN